MQKGVSAQGGEATLGAQQQISPDLQPLQHIRMLIEECLRQYRSQQDSVALLTQKNPSLDRKIIEICKLL